MVQVIREGQTWKLDRLSISAQWQRDDPLFQMQELDTLPDISGMHPIWRREGYLAP